MDWVGVVGHLTRSTPSAAMPAHGEGGAESDGTVGLTAPEVNDEPADARRARRREDVPRRRRRRGERLPGRA